MIRDVMQNHLLQVMALVAMEQPLAFSAEHIMAEKLKVLQAISPLKRDDLVVGQYQRSGKHPGYLEDSTIENKESNTETFAAAVLSVDNPRWDGVPFVLKAGKALTDRKAEVRIQFHRVPGAVSALRDCAANELVVRLQPDETIYWKVINKVPGLKFQVRPSRGPNTHARTHHLFVASHHPPLTTLVALAVLAGPTDAYGLVILRQVPGRCEADAGGVRAPSTRGARGRSVELRLRAGARRVLAHLHAHPQRARRE